MTRAQLARLAAVVGIALVGVFVGRASISSADRQEPSTRTAMAPTERGAVLAAMDYLAALRWDVLVDDAARRRVIAARATPDGIDDLDADLAAGADALREVASRPLTTQLHAPSPMPRGRGIGHGRFRCSLHGADRFERLPYCSHPHLFIGCDWRGLPRE